MAKEEKNVKAEETAEQTENATVQELLKRIEKLEAEKSEKVKVQASVPQMSEKQRLLQEEEKRLSERVKVKLFKDGRDYKDDLFVGINGKGIQIKRGVEVEIERRYANLIDQSLIQSIKAAELMESESQKFASQNQ